MYGIITLHIFERRIPMLLELKNVSKFYYGKETVASGITKVNLKLDNNEFIAITGESGSGKSTLLNVISRFRYL